MNKRGACGVALTRTSFKRPLSMDTLAALESMGDINMFRDRVRELGVAVKEVKPSGHWGNRLKADMLKDCRQLLEQAQGRDVIRARAVELGVKRYKASNSVGCTIWRTTSELHADCDKAASLAQKNSLASVFDRQRKARQAPDSEP